MRKLGIIAVALMSSSAAQAGPIIGLYNTGVNNAGVATTGNGAEPHWNLVSANGAQEVLAYNGGTNGSFPIGPWLAETAASRWVTATPNAATSLDPTTNGTYTFSLNFLLGASNTDSARFTGRFAVDNSVTAVRLNGTNVTRDGNGGFSSWTNFAANSGFVGGNNTLEFVVQNNAQTRGNPMGFRAEFLTSAVPEPSTWAMMIGGFGVVGGAMRRRRTMVARTA